MPLPAFRCLQGLRRPLLRSCVGSLSLLSRFFICFARGLSTLLIFLKSQLFVSLIFLLFFLSVLLSSAPVVAFFNFKISVMSFFLMRLYMFSLCQACKSPDEFINIFKGLAFGPLGLRCDFVIHQSLFSSFTSLCSFWAALLFLP